MFLNKTLKANAVFSLICGVLSLSFSAPLANVMGDVPALLFLVLGIGLIVFAVDVYWISSKLPGSRKMATLIFWADLAWVVLTPVVIAAFYSRLSFAGVMLLVDIAVVVAMFAGLEWRGLKKMEAKNNTAMA